MRLPRTFGCDVSVVPNPGVAWALRLRLTGCSSGNECGRSVLGTAGWRRAAQRLHMDFQGHLRHQAKGCIVILPGEFGDRFSRTLAAKPQAVKAERNWRHKPRRSSHACGTTEVAGQCLIEDTVVASLARHTWFEATIGPSEGAIMLR